jgi:hypothetical protein
MNSNISKALFADYDSGLRPVCGDTTQVNATLGMALRQVIDMVNCVNNVVSSTPRYERGLNSQL